MVKKPKYESYFELWVDELMKLSVGGKVIKKKGNLNDYIKSPVIKFVVWLNKLFYIGKIPFLAKTLPFKSVEIEIERYGGEFDSSKYDKDKKAKEWIIDKEQSSRVRKLLIDRGYKKREDYD